mmetsp:Transcript_25420/g.88708  ORF Transcript_25420/g.88708 Transcript_25420/m.88708 type:complete len:252 (+) Transcript_25420:1143-1898(+)
MPTARTLSASSDDDASALLSCKAAVVMSPGRRASQANDSDRNDGDDASMTDNRPTPALFSAPRSVRVRSSTHRRSRVRSRRAPRCAMLTSPTMKRTNTASASYVCFGSHRTDSRLVLSSTMLAYDASSVGRVNVRSVIVELDRSAVTRSPPLKVSSVSDKSSFSTRSDFVLRMRSHRLRVCVITLVVSLEQPVSCFSNANCTLGRQVPSETTNSSGNPLYARLVIRYPSTVRWSPSTSSVAASTTSPTRFL